MDFNVYFCQFISVILTISKYVMYSQIFCYDVSSAVSWIDLVILFMSPRRSFSNMENEMTSYSMVRSLFPVILICIKVINQEFNLHWKVKAKIEFPELELLGVCNCSVVFACGNRIICVHKSLSKCLLPEGRYLNADIR